MKRLLLLPGMDGTSELFARLTRAVSPWATVQVARYAPRTRESIDDLVAQLVVDAPVTVIAESFSTAVAIRFATRHPALVERLVLAGAFVTPPPASHGLRLLGRLPFLFNPPALAVRTLLCGPDASAELVNEVRNAIAKVAPHVLAHRVAELSRIDERARLGALRVPVMTLSARDDRLISAALRDTLRDACPSGQHHELDGPHLLLQARANDAAGLIREFVEA